MATFFILLIVSCCMLSACCSYEVCLIPENGTSELPSYCQFTASIDHLCQHESFLVSGTTVTLLSDSRHLLNGTCKFVDLRNITLRGPKEEMAVVQFSCEKESGFEFFNVSLVKILNVKFVGCELNWAGKNTHLHLFSLLFVNGSDVTLSNVAVLNGSSVGLYISNVAGFVKIDACEFANSLASGIVVEYDTTMLSAANLSIARSDIRNNGATYLNAAGGVYLILRSSRVLVDITNSQLIGNKGKLGGNVGVTLLDCASVTLSHSLISEGMAQNGAGIKIDIEGIVDYSLCRKQLFSVDNSTIANNTATLNGGGMFVNWVAKPLPFESNRSPCVCISNSSFHGNTGYTMAVVVNAGSTQGSILGISNSIFSKHAPPINEDGSKHILIYSSSGDLGLDGVTIHSNKATAIALHGGQAIFSGTSIISNNTADIGTAGVEVQNAMIILTENSTLVITNNSAQQKGGGIRIYDYTPCGYHYQNCFFKCRPCCKCETQTLKVLGNHATKGGDNIFGYVDSCDNILNVSENSARQPSSVSSDPRGICFDSIKFGCAHKKSVTIYPGQKVSVFVRVVGIQNGSVAGTVLATPTGGIDILESEKTQEVGLTGGYVTFTVFLTQNNSLPNSSILLQPNQDCSYLTVELRISFRNCPFSFSNAKNKYKTFECQCQSSSVISDCSIDLQTITKKKNSWIGMFHHDNRSRLASDYYCPLDYCDPLLQEVKSYPGYLDQDKQCQHNRTGVLCGSCPEGWSLVLGSSECKEECSNLWLLLILPFALAGLVLVAVIHLLNLTVTMGTMNGLIFYANTIQDYSTTSLSTNPISGLTPTLVIFLSWLNLDLGIPTCFYNGMEAFGKTMLLFAFPAYIWLISVVIVIVGNRKVISNRNHRFTKLFYENTVKVLSTLFLLSYSKLLRITLTALRFNMITIFVSNDSTVTNLRWSVDGNVAFFDTKHLVLFVLAIVFIMILLPFSLSLLCIRHLYSLSNYCKVFSRINRLKPFFDTYTGPFEDKASFWTGFLLFVRLVFLIVHTADYKDDKIPYYINIFVCFIIIAIILLLQGVYKSYYSNILECFFVFNISLFFLVHTYQGGPTFWKSVLSHILVGSSFLVFLCIIVYHAYLRLSDFHPRELWQTSETEFDRLSCEDEKDRDSSKQAAPLWSRNSY